ncbi:MAG: MerR family transcriptional regulator [Nitrospiraceae bacterium]|nr:MAG: MerR family transcriptional regulator [Nitrospiraceae bacterium]
MLTKLVFSIHEVSQITGVNAYTIRFWEKDFNEFIKPVRTPGGQRRYCRKDIEFIKRIKHLRYSDKYTISGTIDELEREDRRVRAGASNTGTMDDIREPVRVKGAINTHEECGTGAE